MQPRAQPDLVRRATFSSYDDTEVTEFIRQMYAENSSRFGTVRGGATFSARTHDTPVLGADRVQTSINYQGTSEEGFADYVFFLVHEGAVQIRSRSSRVDATPGDVAFYPLGVPVDFSMHGFDVTTVRLPAGRVAQVAEELTGLPGSRVEFHGLEPVSPGMLRYWRALTGLVHGAMMDPGSPLTSPLLADDLARTVATAALHVFPNSTMTRTHVRGPGAVVPATIRRAVAHIDEHAHLPLSLSDIAAAAGTSPRAIQHGFRKHLDTTPLRYAQRVRLDGARRDLFGADPTRGDTVAAVAARWGFANAGRFAAAYRGAFGEPPAETLRR